MAFRVAIGPAALIDLNEATRQILLDSGSGRAQLWRRGALTAIRGLADSPQSFAIVPEAKVLGSEYRQIHDHSHRIIFEIDEAAQAVIVARLPRRKADVAPVGSALRSSSPRGGYLKTSKRLQTVAGGRLPSLSSWRR